MSWPVVSAEHKRVSVDSAWKIWETVANYIPRKFNALQ